MTDVYDRASELEQADRERIIAGQLAKSEGSDTRYCQCMDCGGQIDEERRKAVRNCRRCIGCAVAEEKIQQFYSR